MLNWFNMNKNTLSQQVLKNEKEIEKLKNLVENGEIESIENIGTSQGDGFTITHIKVIFFDGREEYFDIVAETPGSNPNLLINGDFRVNQRGRSVYTFETDTEAFIRHYTVDRWSFVPQIAYSNSSLTKNTDSISIYFANTDDNLTQYIENFENLSNKDVTASIKIKSFTGGVCSLKILCDDIQIGYKDITSIGLNSFSVTLPNITSTLKVSLVSNSNLPQTIEIEYIKLEIGKVATPNTLTSYAEELSKCQRYYIKPIGARYKTTGCGFMNSETSAFIMIPTPTTMRTKPTLILSSITLLVKGGAYKSVTSGAVSNIVDNCVTLNVQASGLTAGECGLLATSGASGTLELDAEIY